MPELPEVEAYRRLAQRVLGREISATETSDQRFVRGGTSPRCLARLLRGAAFSSARRHGKLLVLDIAGSPQRLGLRFGMTGRLRVDGTEGIDRLVFASDRGDALWDRFSIRFVDGGSLVVRDPRLLGGVVLDPDESALGPDALSVTPAQLRHALSASAAPLKARLLDQARIAGIGNLIADELLWRASLAPKRPAGSLSGVEQQRLQRHLRVTLADLMARGGSHMGDLMPARRLGGRCPRDGTELRRSLVGGRTTWWCARHQV
ncbi:MAG: DNA-formamidopyrimidine glycosylase family protein [Acidimicrobiales bacterium]